jgi:predicted GIY-YIG superfamily endonuclease
VRNGAINGGGNWLAPIAFGCHSAAVETAAPNPAPDANWTVFILRNPAGRCFVGHTDNLPGLLATADEEVAKWTKQPGPWPLAWRHDGLTRSAALKYEVSLKRDKDTARFYTRTGLTPLAPAATDSP